MAAARALAAILRDGARLKSARLLRMRRKSAGARGAAGTRSDLMPSFATLRTEYDELWRSMVIHADKTESVSRIARRLIGLKSRYQAVARRTGVPWVVIAALH